MDVTTMPSMSSLIHKLKPAFADLIFTEAKQFAWSPAERTIYYNPDLPDAPLLLLHEVSHASLNHREYRRDVELLAMETAAWEKAKEHATTYEVPIDTEVIQDHLDTYREWLHARSTCPNCSANGYQVEVARYECLACLHTWRVNEARLCALRRYSLKEK